MTTNLAVGLGCIEITCVTVKVQDHVTGIVTYWSLIPLEREPVQLVEVMYCMLSACNKCSVSALLVYLTPKSSTRSVKEIGFLLCVQSPGTVGLRMYPCGRRHAVSKSFTMRAWGNSYMPLHIST